MTGLGACSLDVLESLVEWFYTTEYTYSSYPWYFQIPQRRQISIVPSKISSTHFSVSVVIVTTSLLCRQITVIGKNVTRGDPH